MSGVSTYGTTNTFFSQCGMAIAAGANGQNSSFIDHSVSGNRLYEHSDGTLEVIPKSPAEVIGERVLRPMIDKIYNFSIYTFQCTQSGFSALDAVFSRILNILPTAYAATAPNHQNAMERCLAAPLGQAVQVAQAGVAGHDPKMIEAAHKLYGPLLQHCISDDSYNKARVQLDENMKDHREQVKIMENNLAKCEQSNQGYKCYKASEIPRKPDIVNIKRSGDDSQNEWKVVPGYLCWTIYIDGWWDKFFASGGYNCDPNSHKPTVE